MYIWPLAMIIICLVSVNEIALSSYRSKHKRVGSWAAIVAHWMCLPAWDVLVCCAGFSLLTADVALAAAKCLLGKGGHNYNREAAVILPSPPANAYIFRLFWRMQKKQTKTCYVKSSQQTEIKFATLYHSDVEETFCLIIYSLSVPANATPVYSSPFVFRILCQQIACDARRQNRPRNPLAIFTNCISYFTVH